MDEEFERTFGKSASRRGREEDTKEVPELPDNNTSIETEGERDL
jgi:hypothetical protein